MNLHDFTELCQREWRERPPGDVVELALTFDSLRSLSAEAAESSSQWVTKVLLVNTPFGYPEVELVNPVTRSAVNVIGGAVIDTAIVNCGGAHPVKQVLL
jgi:hypothetical protein